MPTTKGNANEDETIKAYSKGSCPEDFGWIIDGYTTTGYDIQQCQSREEAGDLYIPTGILDQYEQSAAASLNYGDGLLLFMQANTSGEDASRLENMR